MFTIGQRFEYRDGRQYLLAVSDFDKVSLINLMSGEPRCSGRKVGDVSKITSIEFNEIAGWEGEFFQKIDTTTTE